jgi:hypothetical protein
VLCSRANLLLATRTRCADAVERSQSNFPARAGDGCLDFAEPECESIFFRFFTARDGGRHAALRAALRPASLILPIKRP